MNPARTVFDRLFPNKWRPDNRIEANVARRFPGPGDNFRYRIAGPTGTERIIAYATSEKGKILSDEEFQQPADAEEDWSLTDNSPAPDYGNDHEALLASARKHESSYSSPKLKDFEQPGLANIEFSIELYRKRCGAQGNVALSPLVFSGSLAIALLGAQGETQRQMIDVLKVR